jgi:hypothetical protein
METQENYKNVGMQILVPNNSAEPLNVMSSGNTELSSSCSLEGCSTETLDKVVINRVPVISKSGIPLMPCIPAKARKLLESGLAVGKWSKKLGIFFTRQRPKRFDNRNKEGFIAPSQKAKVEFRLTRKIGELHMFNQKIMFEVEHGSSEYVNLASNSRGTMIPPRPEQRGILDPLTPPCL